MPPLTELLERSEELEVAVFAVLEQIDYGHVAEDLRLDAGVRLAMVSLEHGRALRRLVGEDLFTSSVSLMRSQFEALTRAAWAVWGATDAEVTRMQAPLTVMTEKDARKLTGLSEMLLMLQGKAPAGLVEMLNVFRDTSLSALNSFVHGGIHVVTRHAVGYPENLVRQVVRNSNGLVTMAGMLLALYGNDNEARARMSKMQPQFADCLPPLLPVRA
jgi:hypothetical protein